MIFFLTYRNRFDIPMNFILFLDNINAPSYNDDKVRKMITEKLI